MIDFKIPTKKYKLKIHFYYGCTMNIVKTLLVFSNFANKLLDLISCSQTKKKCPKYAGPHSKDLGTPHDVGFRKNAFC